MSEYLYLDLPPLLTALLAALTCALLGNFLVLKRTSLLGDSLAHSVLPGIVVAFLVTGSRSTWAVLPGAVIAALLATFTIRFLTRVARIDSNAAMGVVFSLFFALGVVLMELAAARAVDLDADCLLFGQLESIFLLPDPNDKSLSDLVLRFPQELWLSAAIFLLATFMVLLLRKELTLAAFDPQLSTALGYRSGVLDGIFYTLVSCAIVASFQVVGSILVIGMLIIPAASARLMTDRLRWQVTISLAFTILAVCGGYFIGTLSPLFLGTSKALSASGMMIVMSGLLLLLTTALAPRYGLASRALKSLALRLDIAREDLLADLYRREEQSLAPPLVRNGVIDRIALALASRRGEVQLEAPVRTLSFARERELSPALTEIGRSAAKELIRSHRLWENYLVDRAGFRSDHVHSTAEKLEHIATKDFSAALATRLGNPAEDPHGREIPQTSERAPTTGK